LSVFVKHLSAFAKTVSLNFTTFAPEFDRVLFYAIRKGMETKGNSSQTEQESSAVSQLRHEAAMDYTRELIEELLSPLADNDSSIPGSQNHN